jgi:hypothetical protein
VCAHARAHARTDVGGARVGEFAAQFLDAVWHQFCCCAFAMMTKEKRARTVLGVLALCPGLAMSACGDDQSSTSPAAATQSAVAVNPIEAARIRTFLESHYKSVDVQHSFHTKFGETIDCIDYFAQPGVKAMAAIGKPMTTLPSPAAVPDASPQLADVLFTGTPDDEGKPRACPAGTVPMLRITPERVAAAGGLDAFLEVHGRKVGPRKLSPGPTPPASGANYAHAITQYQAAGIDKAVSAFLVYSPLVRRTPDHSLAQTWTQSLDQNETVEVGWTVDPALNAGNNPSSPHLFIFSTNDGYTTGCYNNTGGNCLPFILAPQATVTPGMTLSSSTFGGTPVRLGLNTISGDLGYGATGWNIVGVGVYPATNYNAMRTTATIFQIGGEVFDQTGTWVVPMGSGSDINAGLGQTAGLDITLPGGALTVHTASGWHPFSTLTWSALTAEHNYTIAKQTIDGDTLIFFGDKPNVWFGQNSGYEYSPIGDWDGNNFKGECGPGIPLMGISNYADGSASHAILCGQQVMPAGTGSCSFTRSRLFDDGGWDWDPGFVKVECGGKDYVSGVSQSLSGNPDGLLCCPAFFPPFINNHFNCTTEVFGTSQNSPSYGAGPDWDFGFYKGQCPLGKEIAGVSKTSNGIHALLCCVI